MGRGVTGPQLLAQVAIVESGKANSWLALLKRHIKIQKHFLGRQTWRPKLQSFNYTKNLITKDWIRCKLQ